MFDKTNCATNYKFNKREEDNSYFLKSEIKDLESAININDKYNEINNILSNLDIIIFPRSMNEICSNEENNEAIKNISKKIKNNQFYLLSSIIYTADKILFNKVIGVISSSLNLKYILNDNIFPFNKECGISAIDSYFYYPEYVKSAYKTICKYRDKYDNICHMYDNKKCFINQGPILYANKIKYMHGVITK